MVKSYTLAGTAAFVCLVLAIGAVLTTFHILHDISDFYNEAQEELIEFKDIANNVWDEMVFESTPEEMREAEELDREKRSYEEPNPYESESSSTTSTTTTTTSTTTASTTTASGGEETGYDFENDNGPPSSRPKKPMPPTVPRTIQGFRAPPPGATSTYRPPSGRNYDNYGREPASSRRPYPPYQPYQSSSTAVPHSSSKNRPPYNPPVNPQTIVYPPNQPHPRVPYNPPNYTQTPPNPRVPYTGVPVTPPPRQPSGGYDSDRQTPPTWPKVYNTRRPNQGPGYPEDQIPTLPPTPQQPQVPVSQRVPPTQTRNPPQPQDRTNPRQPGGPVPPATTPFNPSDEIPTGKAGSRPGFGPQRPRFPSSTRQRSNPCDQCSAQPNNCPSGPPGPRGRPGPPGFPGQDGPRGLRGLNGGYVGIHPASYDPVIGCVQCPVGPPGERGSDGAPGYPGDDGTDGEQGTNGNDGQPGAPGAPGYPGMNGIPGAPGKPGTPGRNGQSCRSMPGPPGKPGMAGAAGRPGDPGIDGEHGQDGSPGIQGPPGRDGNPGVDGPEGTSAPGAPGTDGGYCPCPKRSSKYDFADVGFIDDDRRPQRPQRPREHSAEHGEQPVHRSDHYDEDSEYSRQRRPNYEPSEETPYKRNRYEEEDRSKEHPKTYTPESRSRRPPPPRQTPRHQERYPEEYEQKPQESRGYENERPRGYADERPRSRPEESHSSGYGGDQRKETAPYTERRPVEQPIYESNNEVPSRTRPLKKVEINRNSDRGYEQPTPRREEYENDRPRQGEDSRRYGTESEVSVEEELKKNVHPPGFRRPKPQEERREHQPAVEESLPAVKQTEKFEGDKRKKTQPEYEDISKSETEEEKSREKHHKKPNKFQEQQWEEHRKSQELRNSREHGGQVSAENTAPMQQVTPKESESRKQRSSAEEKPAPMVHDNYQSSEKQAFSNENPLPSEQLPYRRKTRFYRNHYYEKFLA